MTDSKTIQYPFTDMKHADAEIHNNGNVYHVSKTIMSEFSTTFDVAIESYEDGGIFIFKIPDRYKEECVNYLFTYLPYQKKITLQTGDNIFIDNEDRSCIPNVLELYEFLGCDCDKFIATILRKMKYDMADVTHHNPPDWLNSYSKVFHLLKNNKSHYVHLFYDDIVHSVTNHIILELLPIDILADVVAEHNKDM